MIWACLQDLGIYMVGFVGPRRPTYQQTNSISFGALGGLRFGSLQSRSLQKITDNLSSSDVTCLFVWKSGAIKTPTRRFYRRKDEPESRKVCPWCSFPRASAHHFFVNCIRFEDLRCSLQNSHHIYPQWWANQPRCTTKSGWIVHQAANTEDQRVDCAIAVCKLGIVITKAMMSLDL